MNYHWDGYYKNGQLKYSGDYDNVIRTINGHLRP